MFRLRNSIVVIVLLPVAFLLFFSTAHTQAFYDFGGRVVFTLDCIAPPGVWYVVAGVKGGAFVNYPPESRREWFFKPFPGAQVLGKATNTPAPCIFKFVHGVPIFVIGLPVLYNGIALPS